MRSTIAPAAVGTAVSKSTKLGKSTFVITIHLEMRFLSIFDFKKKVLKMAANANFVEPGALSERLEKCTADMFAKFDTLRNADGPVAEM